MVFFFLSQQEKKNPIFDLKEKFTYTNYKKFTLQTLTSSSFTKILGSGDCVIPKFDANCLTTDCDTSRPAMLENLFSTVFDDPLLFAAIIGDNDAHSEYILFYLPNGMDDVYR